MGLLGSPLDVSSNLYLHHHHPPVVSTLADPAPQPQHEVHVNNLPLLL